MGGWGPEQCGHLQPVPSRPDGSAEQTTSDRPVQGLGGFFLQPRKARPTREHRGPEVAQQKHGATAKAGTGSSHPASLVALSGCVAVGKLLNLSEPQLPQKMRKIGL